MIKLPSLALAAIIAAALAATPASANHSWGSYHWARTANPFTIDLGSNLLGSWPAYISPVSADWSLASVLDTRVVAGARRKRCGAVLGRVEVCNDRYGRNGWLGVASIWTSGGHIVQGTVKLNDTYFSASPYNTAAWRQSVLCQEVGHTFGLGHTSEDPNVDTGTCMDYYRVPNVHPNAHDYEQLGLIYAHLDTTTTIGGGTASSPGKGLKGLRHVRDSLYVEDLGPGSKRFVWVVWTSPGAGHAPPAGA
jgi:hypothetical protein